MAQRDDLQKFEQNRIRVLQEERLHIQKKTFTKWMNSFLHKARMEVDDLFVDLADGKKLLKLLEIISGEKLAKPNNGRMRVHKIENVNKSLAFLHTKVRLESIGAEDIVDGNPRLILGLIWTIILRFQIQEIEIDAELGNESSEKKSAKDALLLWAQRKTSGYAGVEIKDFSGSWRTGLGFNALIHAHRPDLFVYESLLDRRPLDSLNHAFDIANNELSIPSLLDAEDIDTARPDEKSIMTYVASYYHAFAKMKNEEKSGRRIAKIIKQMADADKMKVNYDTLTTDLLDWIQLKVRHLENHTFPNALKDIQALLLDFAKYRTIEKPPKYIERSEIEALYFNINTQLKELRQPAFGPVEGKLVQDIERAWEKLERAEHAREVALHAELRRQERLEQLCYKFERKGAIRESYIQEMIQVLSDPRYGSNLNQVNATIKKHEAISADILARAERVQDLIVMADELKSENYRNADVVKAREAEIMAKWSELLALLDKRKVNLNRMSGIMSLMREIDTSLATMQQLKTDLSAQDTGVHLMAVEELLHKHALQELQVTSLGDTEKRLNRQGENTQSENANEQELLKAKLKELSGFYQDLKDVSASRKALLEEARNFYQFLQDQEDEEGWLIEKQRICQAGVTAKDLRGVLSLQQKHKGLMDEIRARRNKFDQLGATGRQLIGERHPRAEEIVQHIERNRGAWVKLEQLAEGRAGQLQDAAEAYQFYADANEADSYLIEKGFLLASGDYGSDEPSAQALLQRHRDLEGELNAYSGDVQSLNAQADRLVAAGIDSLGLAGPEPVEELAFEHRLVPTEVLEDEPVEKVEYRVRMVEKRVPQVRAKFNFDDHGFKMVKGQVMFLLNKSNPDWWCVRTADGVEGFAPGNYVTEIESRLMQMRTQEPVTVKSVQKVRKTKMVRQKVPVKVFKPAAISDHPVDSNNTVPKRQTSINEKYDELLKLAEQRHALLDDAVNLFKFYKECDDFEKWIKDKERLLATDDPEDSVEEAKRKYEKFVTDLSASAKRMEELDASVKELEAEKHSQIDKIRARHRQIQAAWQRLNRLRATKERSLEGASSVVLFNKTCDEARDWMQEKMTQLDSAVLGHDLKTVQALQRRHDNLERELAPLGEKVHKVMLLARSVQASYPNEQQNIAKRQREVQDLWQQVSDKASERRARLEDAVGQQIFTNTCRDLLRWVGDVKDQLNADTLVRDVQTAQELRKLHQDLGEEIRTKDDEFQQLTQLGRQLLKNNPSLSDVGEQIERLNAEQAALARGFKEKEHWLDECLQLQLFNKEADTIDAATSAHAKFLEFSELGASLDEVEALQKQHRTFTSTLTAQDDRVKGFNAKADALIAGEHYEAAGIDAKRGEVVQRRKSVRELCQARSNELDASKNYQEFCAEVEDLRNWLTDKVRTARDTSYRDLTNLERKLQKHEAFERELRANEGQLRAVNKMGQALIAQDSYRKGDVAQTLKELNDEWQKLAGLSIEKGRRLRQAVVQQEYNSSLGDMHTKFDEIDEQLRSTNVGSDLRSCRDLLKRHDFLEQELGVLAQKMDDFLDKSTDLTDGGHFDAGAISTAAHDAKQRLEKLEEPAGARKAALEEALKYYKFGFEVDTELQWIREHLALASSDALGQNLHQAQNLFKKHKKLEAEIGGHQAVIDKSLKTGEDLIAVGHPESGRIEEQCGVLQAAWDELAGKVEERALKLELSLKAQQFFFEANEVESWLHQTGDILASTDYGRDRDAATKLLTKHKALELELDTYSNIIGEMGRGAQALVQNKHPESKLIAERQASLEHLVRSLGRKAALRQYRLMESLFRHEYFLESEELERWIAEHLQQASSEDYGQDYEHLMVLQAKFEDLKHRIEAGAERFRQCEDLAQKVVSSESAYVPDILKKQAQLTLEEKSEAQEEVGAKHALVSASWDKLHEQMSNRSQRLLAAREIHRFHRDVADALQRIQEKNAALGTDLGRDLNSAVALLRKHEALENELVLLETHLQVLVADSVKLQAVYPTNRDNMRHQQAAVMAAWGTVREKAEQRRDRLQASVDLQRFLAEVRDLAGWAGGLRAAIAAQDSVRSAARAQLLRSEHEALKGEIEAREESFKDAGENLMAMEQTGHYAAAEAADRYNSLLGERERLHEAWQTKKIYLDQLCDLHLFLREAKLIEDATNAQEAALSTADLGESVDEVGKQVRKHEEFEKLIQHQDDKLAALAATGRKLIDQTHFESAVVAQRLAEVEAKRAQVHELSSRRKQVLAEALLHAEFARDVNEAQVWIAEKLKHIEAQIKTSEVTSLEDKIKELQKHQAFKAEIAANEGRIVQVLKKGQLLLDRNHKSAPDIYVEMQNLEIAWGHLLKDVDVRYKGLEEAQDMLEFNNQLDKIESWIRDKEVMIQAGDVGRDYEHCLALQRKLDDVDSDMRIDDTRIRTIKALADKLSKQGHRGVAERKDAIDTKWKGLQGALNAYRDRLAAASEIHLFDRDVADSLERVHEKRTLMESDDLGKDLGAVEVLARKQDALESELSAVERKLEEHGTTAQLLSDRFVDSSDHLQERMEEVHAQWQRLLDAKERRGGSLREAHARHRFLADVAGLEQWVGETVGRMRANQTPDSVADAESLLQLHGELRAEINGRNAAFDGLIGLGAALPDNGEGVARLRELKQRIAEAWEQHQEALTDEYNLQDFKEQTNQLNAWLASKEAFLNNDDVGDTPRAVDALIRKHEDFEAMLKQQLVRIDDLERTGEAIMASSKQHPTDEIANKLNDIVTRKNKLLTKAKDRRSILDQSRALQKFLRNEYDVQVWVDQKLQIAADETYREPQNLQNKIQKHATFEAEVWANQERVHSVIQEGRALVKASHYASDEIDARLVDLAELWRQLGAKSREKHERLNEAYQALLHHRSLDEFEAWLGEAEAQAHSTDTGKDLAGSHNLLKRHTALENDVQQRSDNCEQIHEVAGQFVEARHFMADEVRARSHRAIARYHGLREPLQRRRDLLEGDLMLQQFTRDVDDELQWVADREPVADSKDFGASLTAAQSLQKKHQALEAELSSREPIVGSLAARATQLARTGHGSAPLIEAKGEELKGRLGRVRDCAAVRRLRLQDSLEVHGYYEEAGEAEAWLSEKRQQVASKDIGRDEDSAESLRRKLEAVALELRAFEGLLAKLDQRAEDLITKQHFDSENIETRRGEICDKFAELRRLLAEREVRLSEALQYFAFVRECNEVQDWMRDQVAKTDSEEYGNDLEHVELLIQAFDTFYNGLMNSEPRIQSCVANGLNLIEAKSRHGKEVEQRVDDVKTQWADLLELAAARKDALTGARQVHVFDRTAEEIITWMGEKNADLAYDTYGQDLESIQDLIRHHQTFENEMKAIREKVDFIEGEGKRIIAEFPDTKEHIEDKLEDTISNWEDLQDGTEKRKEHLHQAEELQVYFDQYQDLLAWISEMLAKITAPDLPQDCSEAELLIERHREHKVEIEARSPIFDQFYESGSKLVKEKHNFAEEISERIDNLKQRMELLSTVWSRRAAIYEQNHNVQVFKRDASALENWLLLREGALREGKSGESILHVEELIRKHRDFEESIKAQEEKFEALKAATLVERAFAAQLKQEAGARLAERERLERARVAQRKQLEIERINDQRRQEGRLAVEVEVGEARPTAAVRKTNSVVHLLDREKFRGVKRSESVHVAGSRPKRTLSFNTRRRGSRTADAPQSDVQMHVERKQVLGPGAKRAANRGWKASYTVLCGQLLAFFKGPEEFAASKGNAPPVNIHQAVIEVASDYHKRKHAFRLTVSDGSEFLFACENDEQMREWIQKIGFRAQLPPSQQLLNLEYVQPKDHYEHEISSQSSRTSSPDVNEEVVLRHELRAQNGSGSVSPQSRHTLGESPPPLPMSQPPNNYTGQRHYSIESNGSYYDSSNNLSRNDSISSVNRPASMQPNEKSKSSRLKDLFFKKKKTNSFM